MMRTIKIKWQNRLDSLEPSAVVAFGQAAVNLKKKLLSFEDERLFRLRGIHAENLLFIAGNPEDLPWADGVIYLGKDALAPSLLLPTNRRPNIPLDLFEKKLLREFSAQKPFVAVGEKIIPIGEMRSVSRKILSEIL